MQTQEHGYVGGDFLIEELGTPLFCRETKSVVNGTADDITLEAGHPMNDNVPVVAGQEAQTDGLVVEKVTVFAGTTQKVAVVARQAVINRDALPENDYAGDALNLGTIATALTALTFIVRREPTEQTEHTT
jgi:hypothetical protein